MAETGRLKVAVIGAGAAGLVALRHLGDRLDRFQPVAFEQSPQVGGTWVYTDDIGTDSTTGLPVHSSMYRHLRVNIPVEVSHCSGVRLALFDIVTVRGQGHSCLLKFLNVVIKSWQKVAHCVKIR